MQRFLSILLAICLCLAVMAACNAPVNNDQNPGTTLPSGSSEPTGGNGGTESTGTTEATGSTEPTEGNSTNGSTDSTEGTLSPDSKLKGEQITEEQYNSIIANVPTNYTYTETRTYQGKTQVITMLVSGEEYLQTRVDENNDTRKIMGILRGNHIKDYMFNEVTGKWETSSISVSTNYPLESFPYPMSSFTYDEASGSYIMTMGGSQLQLMFKDGHLVFLGIIDGENQDMVYFCDYGTTVIPVPNDADIVDKDNTNNSVSDPDNH